MVSGIERFLTSPSTVAQALVWHSSRPALFVHLGARAIDLATLSLHSATASFDDDFDSALKNPIQSLPSIRVEEETHDNAKYLKPRVLEQLSRVVQEHNVCGLVVSWPVQREGWMGAPCGKVMHALDQISNETTIVAAKTKAKPQGVRPICLWDGFHFAEQHSAELQDKFERLPLYASTRNGPACSIYRASQEHYKEEGMQAAAVAADYLKAHWPELAARLDIQKYLPQQQEEEKQLGSKLDTQETLDIRSAQQNGKTDAPEHSSWTKTQMQEDHDKPLPTDKDNESPSPATAILRDQGEIQSNEEFLWIATNQDVGGKVPGKDYWNTRTMTTTAKTEEAGEIEESEEMLWTMTKCELQQKLHARKPQDEPGNIKKLEEMVWGMKSSTDEPPATKQQHPTRTIRPPEYSNNSNNDDLSWWNPHALDVAHTDNDLHWVARMLSDPRVVRTDMAVMTTTQPGKQSLWKEHYFPPAAPVAVQHQQQRYETRASKSKN